MKSTVDCISLPFSLLFENSNSCHPQYVSFALPLSLLLYTGDIKAGGDGYAGSDARHTKREAEMREGEDAGECMMDWEFAAEVPNQNP